MRHWRVIEALGILEICQCHSDGITKAKEWLRSSSKIIGGGVHKRCNEVTMIAIGSYHGEFTPFVSEFFPGDFWCN